ncbi:MAG: bifunctional diaminohydroxyphosphoribosylaminopyrimidine deaminase/5-amino-6-(5-phosphoribosylamino)uracil reductase RibD [Bacteroidota bacterium]
MKPEQDEIFMRRCFELAVKGLGLTKTNPVVGCVIVHRGKIIGEGYHHEFGGPHAEVNAIRSVKNKELLKDSTLYCSLEPCSHYGKTPPCSLLIRQSGIPRVVVANLDPNPQVSGAGLSQLREAGVEVKTQVLEEEGFHLNRRFFTYHTLKRPYVILKWARSRDGYIDLLRNPGDPVGPNWITEDVARTLVHKWRAEEAAVMVGTDTVLNDNPQLNVRRWTGRNPVRITIDRKGRIRDGLHILDGSLDTIIFSCLTDIYPGEVRALPIDPAYHLRDILGEMYNQHLISVMVEGGARLLNSFISTGLWDEARIFTGKVLFRNGVVSPFLDLEPEKEVDFMGNRLSVYRNPDRRI